MKAKAIGYPFFLAGIGMLAAAFFTYTNTSTFLKDAIKTEGTVIELIRSRSYNSITYRPVVVFVSQKGEEIEFTPSSSSNPPSYSKGQKVAIFYLPDNPQKAKINGFFSLWGAPIILGVMGSIFFTLGASIFIVFRRKEREEKYLKQQGTPIETKFRSVEIDTTESVNDRHPFRVITQWQNPSTKEIHVFESSSIGYDPSEFITSDPITVFIERDNPKKYLVDLSFLPKLAE